MRLNQSANSMLLCSFVLMLSACGSMVQKDSAPSRINVDINAISDAVPKAEPLSRYGNPESYEVFGKVYHPLKHNKGFTETGIASWYGTKFHGRRTSSGEPYDMFAMTAAHKTLPLPTYVRVTNLDNNRQVIVKVNDRGPFHDGRIIDLSYAAAMKLDIAKTGTGRVEIEAISFDNEQDDGVFVQVGAFRDELNAQNVQLQLANADIASDIKPVTINARKQLFRVRIGPFKEKKAADEVVESLRKMGLEQARVFSKNEF